MPWMIVSPFSTPLGRWYRDWPPDVVTHPEVNEETAVIGARRAVEASAYVPYRGRVAFMLVADVSWYLRQQPCAKHEAIGDYPRECGASSVAALNSLDSAPYGARKSSPYASVNVPHRPAASPRMMHAPGLTHPCLLREVILTFNLKILSTERRVAGFIHFDRNCSLREAYDGCDLVKTLSWKSVLLVVPPRNVRSTKGSVFGPCGVTKRAAGR